jgi:hypothetical protein
MVDFLTQPLREVSCESVSSSKLTIIT